VTILDPIIHRHSFIKAEMAYNNNKSNISIFKPANSGKQVLR